MPCGVNPSRMISFRFFDSISVIIAPILACCAGKDGNLANEATIVEEILLHREQLARIAELLGRIFIKRINNLQILHLEVEKGQMSVAGRLWNGRVHQRGDPFSDAFCVW